MSKKILFITGTRADYGKIKSLIKSVEASDEFEAYVYVSGMHLVESLGNTYKEVLKDSYEHVQVAYGLANTRNASYDLGDVICNLTGYVGSIEPDMIVVHGDRIDALAGACVGALNNILVAHIEGGELSGTIDESLRHAISKLSHIHLVSNEEARDRLIQMGEIGSHIFIMGSPDIDIMLSDALPDIDEVKTFYEIPYDRYAILMYHPVTTEYDILREHVKAVVDAVIESNDNYVVIYPNNDKGYELILSEYKRLESDGRFRIFPSLRFERFLSLLKQADYIIGNSSAGIRESCVYGIPDIDIGTRQTGRYSTGHSKNIQHVSENKDEILAAIGRVDDYRVNSTFFGDGHSTDRFMEILGSDELWDVKIQKRFIDFNM